MSTPGSDHQHDPVPHEPVGGVEAPQTGTPWPWAVQRPMQTIETEPLEYHRLYRGVASYRWWKPLVVLMLAGFFFLAGSLVFGLLLGGVLFAFYPMDEAMLRVEELAIPDTQDPFSVAFGLSSVILTMIPAVWLAMWIVGFKPASRVLSVALKLRWSLLWRTMGIAVLAVVVMNAAGVLLSYLVPAGSESTVEPVDIDVNAAMLSMLFVVLLVPLQAAAEEILFRGALMQIIGAWLRSPWFAILVPSIGFALAHAPTYGVWGMLSVGMMGLVAAWLTWRTGGLEAAISIHVINNLFAFSVMATGFAGSTDQNDDGANPLGLLGQGIGFVFFVWMTLRSFRKHGYGRTRIDLLQVPAESTASPATNGNSNEGQTL